MAGEPSFSSVVATLRTAGCVFAEDEARLLIDAASSPAGLTELVRRRVAGLPLEHVLGWVQFCGLRVQVEPGVFVPRRRTQLVVREALSILIARTPTRGRPVVVDLCCGCGALGAALAAAHTEPIELSAADIDPAAVRCARRNVEPHGGRVHEGDLYDALPDRLRERVDLLLVNAPYVPTQAIATMPPEAREHEPLVALDGGADGLFVLRRVVAHAGEWLRPGGSLLVETSDAQVDDLSAAFQDSGLSVRVAEDDEMDATVLIGTWRAGVER